GEPTQWATAYRPERVRAALGYTLSPTSWAYCRISHAHPGLRGLALGYTPSPTTWAYRKT
ncbi:MAG TPA: hypothetical protein VLG74_15145, partial [Blastocatellia bacterium]|nr:hypothetical protein [Blastocatellia bacterium]